MSDFAAQASVALQPKPDVGMLDNLVWHALNTEHAHLVLCTQSARKYRAEIAPFGGTVDNSAESFKELLTLLEPGECTYVICEACPEIPGLIWGERVAAVQMTVPESGGRPISDPNNETQLARLSEQDVPAMVALTTLAFPGYFRQQTHRMGKYYGIRVAGELVAMAGERMAVPGFREISGVCTHPAHTGKRYAATLISRLMKEHAQTGLRSFLHVGSGNTRAIALYERLGFQFRKEISLRTISRSIGP